MEQLTTSTNLKTRWYSGSRAATLSFETPLTRNEVASRLRAFQGFEIFGGQSYRGGKVVASVEARGFYVSMRGDFLVHGDLTAILPLTATCRWLPMTSGTGFEATIVPTLAGRTLIARVAFTVAVVIVLGLLLGQMGVPGFVAALLALGPGFWLSGLVVPKNELDHDLQQCQVMSRFLRETLEAQEVGSEHDRSYATT